MLNNPDNSKIFWSILIFLTQFYHHRSLAPSMSSRDGTLLSDSVSKANLFVDIFNDNFILPVGDGFLKIYPINLPISHYVHNLIPNQQKLSN